MDELALKQISCALFDLINGAHVDAETKAWARAELSKIFKIAITPTFFVSKDFEDIK